MVVDGLIFKDVAFGLARCLMVLMGTGKGSAGRRKNTKLTSGNTAGRTDRWCLTSDWVRNERSKGFLGETISAPVPCGALPWQIAKECSPLMALHTAH
jgi:hypothetical protein